MVFYMPMQKCIEPGAVDTAGKARATGEKKTRGLYLPELSIKNGNQDDKTCVERRADVNKSFIGSHSPGAGE